jgi:hypothetical protein
MLKNSIVGTNLAGGNGYGVITDAGYNLSSDSSLGLSHTGSINHTNPLLQALANNGGATETMALGTNSPAIDAGDPSFCLPFDQRMIPRPVGPRCDMGAYEFGANPMLSFITQPASLTVTNGSTAQFTVMVMGAAPFTYHWTFNGQDILDSGPTTSSRSSYSITSAQSQNAGNYEVVVVNFSGSVTSAVATLSVLVPPIIIQQPVSLTVTQGNSAAFTASASGVPPPDFQWLFNGAIVGGATNSSFTISSAQAANAGKYSLIVSNSAGTTNSTQAVLHVLNPPAITAQPLSQVVKQGKDATFNVTASGDAPLSYHWYFNSATPVGSATNATLTISNAQPANAGNYSVIVSNGVGAVASTAVPLTVLPTFPVIVTQPQSLTNTAGSTAQFMVVADGEAPLFYQWRTNGVSIPGASSAGYSLSNVQTNNAGAYDVIVANSFGSVVSAQAFLTVLAPPVIAAEPQSQTNSACSTATFSVTVNGSAPLTYHWNFNGTDLPGATNATLTLTGVQPDNDGRYYVVVANAVGLAISSTVTLSVLPGPALTITNLYQTGSTFGFSFATTTGCTYISESKTGLADLSWTAVATNAGTGGMITNTFSTTTPSQFYRLRIE